jgi:hypothetical protein
VARLPRLHVSLERRKSRRSRIFEPARLLDHRGDKQAHVLDISTTGLLLHAPHAPKLGQHIGISFAGEAVVGRVAWIDRRYFGVALLEPLDERTVLRIIAGSARVAA